MTTLLLVDDHQIVRKGIAMLIASFPDEYKINEATTCKEMMKSLRTEPADYIILDLSLIDGSSFSMVDNIKEEFPQSAILVYSMNAEKIYAKRLLQKGVSGFVSKQAPIEELQEAIKCMFRGEVYVSPALAQVASFKENDLNPIDLLSDRELEVVEYLISGLGTKEISNKMDVSITTASTFRKRAYEKFGVDNIIELKEKFFLYKDV